MLANRLRDILKDIGQDIGGTFVPLACPSRDRQDKTFRFVPVSRLDAPSRPVVLASMKKPARGGLCLRGGWRVRLP